MSGACSWKCRTYQGVTVVLTCQSCQAWEGWLARDSWLGEIRLRGNEDVMCLWVAKDTDVRRVERERSERERLG